MPAYGEHTHQHFVIADYDEMAHWHPALRIDEPSPKIMKAATEESSKPNVKSNGYFVASDRERESNSFGQGDTGAMTVEDSLQRTTSRKPQFAFFDELGEPSPVPRALLEPDSPVRDHDSVTGKANGRPNGLSLPMRSRSFADSSSDEEDESSVDPAWGIPRTDSSQVFSKIVRSNSFPDTPTLSSDPIVESQLPTTEVEAVIQEEEAEELAESPLVRASASSEGHTDVRASRSLSRELEEILSENQNEAATARVYQPEEAVDSQEARYDEGVPLVASDSYDTTSVDESSKAKHLTSHISVHEKSAQDLQTHTSGKLLADEEDYDVSARRSTTQDRRNTTNPVSLDALEDVTKTFGSDDLFESGGEVEETSFFDKVEPDKRASSPPPPLERKGTAEVLESLSVFPDDPPDSPIQQTPAQQDEAQLFSQEELTEAEDTVKDLEQPTSSAAGWGALFEEDDEFLVEDAEDLLPDSRSGSPDAFAAALRGTDDNIQGSALDPGRAGSVPSIDSSLPSSDRRTSQTTSGGVFNPYTPHQPSSTDMSNFSPTGTAGNVGLQRPGFAPLNSFGQTIYERQQQSRPNMERAESFVDQKGAYKSPYDLPMELSQPRRRPQQQKPTPPSIAPPPPPRTTSMSSQQRSGSVSSQLQSPFSPTAPSFPTALRSPTAQARSLKDAITSPPRATSALPSKASGFFEELPIAVKPRPPTGQRSYTPQHSGTMHPAPGLRQSPPSRVLPPPQSQGAMPPPQRKPSEDPYAHYQLQRPEKLDPFSQQPLQAPAVSSAPVANARYSPAPAGLSGPKPTPSPRYSPAPPAQKSSTPPLNRYASQPAIPFQAEPTRPPPVNRYISQPASNAPPASLPHQPRTSSPLAYQTRIPPTGTTSTRKASGTDPSRPPLSSSGKFERQVNSDPFAAPYEQTSASTGFGPPRRSQTQSPSKLGGPVYVPSVNTQIAGQRPVSAHGQVSPTQTSLPVDAFPPNRPAVRQRGLSQHVNFVEPTDGQQLDPLKRWKGAPIIKFGFGGSVLTSFPKHVPRYSVGSTLPRIQPTAGEIRARSTKEFATSAQQPLVFPGPLRSKAKKKEVLTWLNDKIALIEQGAPPRTISGVLPDPHKCHEEKVLLWKVMRVMVEHDGLIEGNDAVRKAIGGILSPEVYAFDDASATSYGVGDDVAGIYAPVGAAARSDVLDPNAVEFIRKSLVRGEREKAVWSAVDNRLWAHAMLVASTLPDRGIWKQVVQEFVRQEVRGIGMNTQSLATLYEVFAGNLEESVDELVPPSARAGLQMVSKIDSSGPTKNAMDGLDRWRETLSLILSNRSQGDHQAIASLGRLLVSYGRTEAAHICFLFSRSAVTPNVFGGADDPQCSIVLLGADHKKLPQSFHADEDSVLLTEIYEFATTILPGTASAAMPHLQAYKLQHATTLAEAGFRTEAQAYCEAVGGSFRSSTKMSPYYHPQFLAALDELSQRLRQAPVEASSSWMGKFKTDKVSASLFTKLGNFVAGEDSDAASTGSNKDANEYGPFAKVNGTPNMSRSGSITDLYGSYPGNAAAAPVPVPQTGAGSRYAPGAQFSARSSSESTRGRNLMEFTASPPAFNSPPQVKRQTLQYEPGSYTQQSYANPYIDVNSSAARNSLQPTPPQSSYALLPVRQEETASDPSRPPYSNDSYVPTPPLEQQTVSYIPTPPQQAQAYSPTPPPQSNLEPEPNPWVSNSHRASPIPDAQYSPPEQIQTNEDVQKEAYQAPSQLYGYDSGPMSSGYVPYVPEPDSDSDSSSKPKPKKRTFGDDDEDDFPRVSNSTAATSQLPPSIRDLSNSIVDRPASSGSAALSTSSVDQDAIARRKANDAAANAAFLAAAEADAARDKVTASAAPTTKKGWGLGLGGLFRGGSAKKDSLDASPAASGKPAESQKAIRAKLGEKNKFYYDEKLKKWVNPDDKDSMTAKAATPPPPMAGPRGMTPSASMSALSAPPSRAPSGMQAPPMNMGMGPPSRNATPDTTPAVPGSRPGSTAPPIPGTGPQLPGLGLAPPSRPGTSNSVASNSLDDLLGGPAAGGKKSVKGKKGGRGGRYIDVMADKK